MHKDFYYLSPHGEVIDFLSGGRLASPASILSYDWTYINEGKKLTSISAENSDKSLVVLFYSEDEGTTAQIRNEAYIVFDRDIRAGTPGRLYVGDYYMECYIKGASNLLSKSGRFVKTEYSIISCYPAWRKETLIENPPYVAEDDVEGLDYPYAYPYDYAMRRSGAKTINNPSPFASHFRMILYGPSTAPPVLSIGSHRYGLTRGIADGCTVTIDSMEKTIYMHDEARQRYNWLNARIKEESIFELIPEGIAPFVWDGSFGFDLYIVEERSEPPFYVPEYPENALLAAGEYILTSDGLYLSGG